MDFNKNTIFIIGAGASAPYGLPLGVELKNSFNEVVYDHPDKTENPTNLNNFKFLSFLKEEGFSLSFIEDVIDQILGTGSASVDEFLKEKEENSKESKFIKLLIYYCISQKCVRSNFLMNDWIEPLISYLMEHHQESFLSGNISFISFNYEQLLRAKVEFILRKKFNIQDYIYRNVIHVYGKILDYSFRLAHAIDENELNEIYEESKYLSLFRKELPKTSDKVTEKLNSAENIIMLGYGFNRENNHILVGIDGSASSFYAKNTIATAFGLNEEDRSEISRIYGLHALVEDKKNLELVNELIRKVFV